MIVLELMNETFNEIYGFVPLNDNEKNDFAGRYLPILDPEFIKVVEATASLSDLQSGCPMSAPESKLATADYSHSGSLGP